MAVIGLGAIGGTAAAVLAERGHHVIGFDRFRPPHGLGSSHGETRMLREGYYHGSPYVPLVHAAAEGWRALERRTGRTLLSPSGGLMIGPPGARVFAGSLEGARKGEIDCELLTADETRRRFPAFDVPDGFLAVFEPRAGILDVDACLAASLDLAAAGGAEVHLDEPVTSWIDRNDGVAITTASGEYRARRLAIAAGAWTASVSNGLDLPLEVERTVQFWFEPATGADVASLDGPLCPPWVWEHEEGLEWYGFPLRDGTQKVGVHRAAGRTTDPDTVRREVDSDEVTRMRERLRRYMPDAAGECSRSDVCLYTSTPDRGFVLGRHPRHPAVALFCGGSGHAFKFAHVLGEMLADLATDREPAHDISPFRLERFA